MCRDSDLKYVCYADPNLAPELAKASSDQIHELTRKTGGFRHALADGLDAAVATKILQLSSWSYFLSQSELRLPLLQVVSSNKYFSVGVQSPTEINAPRGRTLSGRQWFCADRNGV